jgi:hypothetical protein
MCGGGNFTLTATTINRGYVNEEIIWSGDPAVEGRTGKSITVQINTPGEKTIVATCGKNSKEVKITVVKAVIKSVTFTNDHAAMTDYNASYAGSGGNKYPEPEWNMPPSKNSPVTYTIGQNVTAKVILNVQPAGVSLDLEGDSSTDALDFKLFGITSTGSDQEVNVTGAVNLPARIDVIDSNIIWRIKNIGGAGSPVCDGGTFDPLRIYLTWDYPGYPDGEPTIKRIDWVCNNAKGATSPEEIADKLQLHVKEQTDFGYPFTARGWQLLDGGQGDCDDQAQLMEEAIAMLGYSPVALSKVTASTDAGPGCCNSVEFRDCPVHGPEALLFVIDGIRNRYEGSCVTAGHWYTITPLLKGESDYDILNQLAATGHVIQKYFWAKPGATEFDQPCDQPDSSPPFP